MLATESLRSWRRGAAAGSRSSGSSRARARRSARARARGPPGAPLPRSGRAATRHEKHAPRFPPEADQVAGIDEDPASSGNVAEIEK